MRLASQLLLTFLFNACWQIALVTATIALAARLLRKSSMRLRHLLWVVALLLSVGLPILTGSTVLSHSVFSHASQSTELPALTVVNPLELPLLDQANASRVPADKDSAIQINRKLAAATLALYLLFVIYRAFRLGLAAKNTRAITQGAYAVELSPRLQTIIDNCQTAFASAAIRLRCSRSVAVPLTVGVRRPLVVLPEDLLRDGDEELLTSAIGHEAVHVLRRDCLLNLIYEVLYLPLSFHPAAALIRRRIKQTRELCCDELVADRLLQSDVYARSLVRLAGSAAPSGKLAVTTTVGIADADILEVRIMSLLNRSETDGRGRRLVLIAAALLLALPCMATAFAFRFDVTPQDPAPTQENAQKKIEREAKERTETEEYKKGFQLGQEEKERRERAGRDPEFKATLEQHQREERELMERRARETLELEERIKRETNSEARATLEAQLQMRLTEQQRAIESAGMYKMNRERELQGGLAAAKWAKISMEQAIQIATSQRPGTVLQCRLIGEREDRVFYDIVVVSGDEENPVTKHVLVNAIDGGIIKAEPRQGAISGGVLNGKALHLPMPAYPEIARTAQASGSVSVEITIDEVGNVIAARAVSGHPLLQAAAVTAARQAQFSPTRLQGQPVKVSGIIVYNFVVK